MGSSGAKLKKKIGYIHKNGEWHKTERGGILTMCNPGGVVSETFRDISRARNKARIEQRQSERVE